MTSHNPGKVKLSGVVNHLQKLFQNKEDAVFVFEGRAIEPDIFVPSDISQMTKVPNQGRQSWSTFELLDLAESTRQSPKNLTQAGFVILFVNGYLDDGEGANNSILGISITGTPVIIMFKDVVSSAGWPIVQTFVEQSTMVHEMGHALGLVNNGVSMTIPHQDSANGAHCSNPDCVMYWKNEGATELYNFVMKFITTGQTSFFGQNCRNDTRTFNP